MNRTPLLLAATSLAALVLTACDKPATPTDSAQATGSTAADPAPAAAAAANDRPGSGSIAESFAITNPDIAKTLPAFVKLPGGVRIVTHMPFSNGIRKGGTIMGDSGATQDEMVAYFRETMPSADLIMKPERTGAKGEVTLQVESADAKSDYQVSVFPQKNGRTVFQANYVYPEG